MVEQGAVRPSSELHSATVSLGNRVDSFTILIVTGEEPLILGDLISGLHAGNGLEDCDRCSAQLKRKILNIILGGYRSEHLTSV